jgi:DNA-binding response OmpR family regulator
MALKSATANIKKDNSTAKLEEGVIHWQRRLEEVLAFLDDLKEHLARLPQDEQEEAAQARGGVEVEPENGLVSLRGIQASLTPTELKLLNILSRSSTAVPAADLAWKMYPDDPSIPRVRVQLSLLRKKLKVGNSGANPIETVRYGYRWRPDIASSGD